MDKYYEDSEISEIESGKHVLCLYRNNEEHWHIILPYLLSGIEKGEHVFYFCLPEIADATKQKLTKLSDKAQMYIEKKLINFFTDDRIFMRDGVFNPFDVIAFFYAETQRALSEGFRAVRIAQEMAWGGKMLEDGTLLAQHDIALNKFIQTIDCSLLCLYDERKFEPRVLVNILRGHPYVFTRNRLMKNFYYIPPTDEMVLGLTPINLEYMIESLIRHYDYKELGMKSAGQLSTVFQNVPIAMLTVDKDRKIKMINPKGEKILNADILELINEKFGDAIGCINSFDNEKGCGFGTNCNECPIRKAIATTFETGKSITNVEAEITKHHQGNTKTSYYLVSTCLLDEQEKTILVCLLDITKRKGAESKLKKEIDKSEKLLSIVGDMILVLDTDGNVKKVNRTTCEVLGYTEEEILGKNWFDNFILERDREEIKQVFSSIKIGALEHYKTYQTQLLTKSGDKRLIEWNNSFILDDEGNIEGIISSGRDITDYHNLLITLKASEEKYRLIAENVSDVIWTTDLNLCLTYISPSVKNVLGYTPEELSQVEFSNILTEPSWEKMMEIHKEQEALRKSGKADEKKTLTVELEAHRKDGVTIWTETNLSYLTDERGKIHQILGVTRDVSQKKNMMVMDRLIQVGQIAAGVVHEINNPTSYIMTNNNFFSDAVKEMDSTLNDLSKLVDQVENEGLKSDFLTVLSNQGNFINEMKEAIEENTKGLERIKTITSQLKQFSRSDSEAISLVNVNEVINSAITMVYNQINQFAKFNKNLQEPLPAITGKIGNLSQVFVNLLVNAVQAIAQKGEEKEKNHIGVSSCLEGDKIVVAIEDSGTGIQENIRNKIFDQFFTTKERGGGTGLGLALCKKVVMEHNGEINFESEVGKGTIFKVILPLDTGLQISEKTYKKITEKLSSRAKILLLMMSLTF